MSSIAAPARPPGAGACTFPPAARPGRRTTSRTPGSSASRRRVVVGVWVGFDQPKTIGRDAYGSRYALPIWSDFMRRATRIRRPQSFEIPDGLQEMQLCRISYLRPVEGCPIYTEYFKPDDKTPGRLCTLHQGTVKQRVRRAMEDFFSILARKIRGIVR